MVVKVVTFFCLVAAASALVVPGAPAPVAVAAPLTKLVYAEPEEGPIQYEYEYSVQDPQTGDDKSSKENRNGNDVHGYYALVQPDGVRRIVEYTSSKEHGFNAVVRYEGAPVAHTKVHAPAPVAYAAAPVAKVAYAQAPVAYAPAPVAKVAYAPAPVAYAPAPVAKVAYAPAPVAYAPAPVSKVAYAPAPVAYAPAPVAYAPGPVAKIAYAQQGVTYAQPGVSYAQQGVAYAQPGVAYAQPLAKFAYSPAASVSHATYASPSVSYQH